MMANRIVVDPIARIEGHLRVEAEVKDGKIAEAYSSGTSVRGIELILEGRDPRDVWAFTQRICGVCTTTHALCSVRAVEHALDIKIPKNANLIRNIMNEAQFLHDHTVHFYHLHALDWVDVVSALDADPNETSRIAQSISDWPNSSPGYFKDVQNKVKKVVESGQLGIFANGYWGHPLYKLPPEVNLLAVAHYLEALDWQKEFVKIHTILGGKNPHPHYVVGGMATPIDINSDNAIHAERLMHISKIIDQAREFVNKVYIPDLLAIGSYYKDWLHGDSQKNYIVYGDFPTGDIRDVETYRAPRGIILDGDLSKVYDFDLADKNQIQEFIDRSYYVYNDGKDSGGRHPSEGETNLKYSGPNLPYDYLDVDKKYSWVKAPRWKNKLMETGPLARVLVGYASGREDYVETVNEALQTLDVPVEALHSAIGRMIARGLETKIVAEWLRNDMDDLLNNIKNGDQTTFDRSKWDPKTWPKNTSGIGWMEAPRGSLGHWTHIVDGKIHNYQAVVPTTWNASPADNNGNIGPLEASIKGTPIADPKRPLEILRIVHSYDPCLSCAVHLTDLENKETTKIMLG